MKLSCTRSINVLDCLLLLFVAFIAIINKTVSIDVAYKVIILILAYSASRILFSAFPLLANRVILLGLIIACSYELFLGMAQLSGHSFSNHYLYLLTGSFDNPGPYGGFMAVCLSLVGIYILDDEKENKHKTLLRRIHSWILYLFIIAILCILPLTRSRSAILAFVCSAAIYYIISFKNRPYYRKVLIISAFVSAFLCVGAYFYKKPSADGRFFINRICLNSIIQNDCSGAGLGHFGGAYGKAQALYFEKRRSRNDNGTFEWRQIKENERLTADCPDRAFNEFMQIGVENGLIMMILFAFMIVLAILKSLKASTIWGYGLIAFSIFALFSYPLHIIQFQIILTILLAASASSQSSVKASFFFAPIITLASILIIKQMPEVKQMKNAEKEWRKVERWYLHENYEYVAMNLEPLFSYMKGDYRYLFAYGQSLNKIGEYEKSDSILKMGTEISSDPMFWNVMGNNSLAMGRYREAEERYKHAFYMVPNRLYPLNLLAKLYYAEGDTARFLDMADKVETFIPKVESTSTAQLRDEIRLLKTDILLKQEP